MIKGAASRVTIFPLTVTSVESILRIIVVVSDFIVTVRAVPSHWTSAPNVSATSLIGTKVLPFTISAGASIVNCIPLRMYWLIPTTSVRNISFCAFAFGTPTKIPRSIAMTKIKLTNFFIFASF